MGRPGRSSRVLSTTSRGHIIRDWACPMPPHGACTSRWLGPGHSFLPDFSSTFGRSPITLRCPSGPDHRENRGRRCGSASASRDASVSLIFDGAATDPRSEGDVRGGNCAFAQLKFRGREWMFAMEMSCENAAVCYRIMASWEYFYCTVSPLTGHRRHLFNIPSAIMWNSVRRTAIAVLT